MIRRLYGWEKEGKFYLSAFNAPRPDGKRPAIQYDTKDDLQAEVTNRSADLVWEEE